MSVKLNIANIVKNFDTFCSVGLSNGIKDGEGADATFCVEAAIDLSSRGYTLSKARKEDQKLADNYADGKGRACEIEITDQPSCVAQWARSEKISLNDEEWSSPELRGRALRTVGILQLGSKQSKNGLERFNKLVREFMKARAERLVIATLPKKFTWADIKKSDAVQAFIDADCNYPANDFEDVIIDTLEWWPTNKKIKSLISAGDKRTEENDRRYCLRAEAYEYAFAKLDTPGYKWLVKNEGYKIPTP